MTLNKKDERWVLHQITKQFLNIKTLIIKQDSIRDECSVHEENCETARQMSPFGIVRSRQHRLRQLAQPLWRRRGENIPEKRRLQEFWKIFEVFERQTTRWNAATTIRRIVSFIVYLISIFTENLIFYHINNFLAFLLY